MSFRRKIVEILEIEWRASEMDRMSEENKSQPIESDH